MPVDPACDLFLVLVVAMICRVLCAALSPHTPNTVSTALSVFAVFRSGHRPACSDLNRAKTA